MTADKVATICDHREELPALLSHVRSGANLPLSSPVVRLRHGGQLQGEGRPEPGVGAVHRVRRDRSITTTRRFLTTGSKKPRRSSRSTRTPRSIGVSEIGPVLSVAVLHVELRHVERGGAWHDANHHQAGREHPC